MPELHELQDEHTACNPKNGPNRFPLCSALPQVAQLVSELRELQDEHTGELKRRRRAEQLLELQQQQQDEHTASTSIPPTIK